MFAARPATEIFPGHKYASAVTWIVEREIRTLVAFGIKSPVAEQVFAEPFTRGDFKKTS